MVCFGIIRSTVREKLEQIILLDLEYSTNHNVDQLLWKSVYHQILENLRSELLEEDSPETRAHISHILNEVCLSVYQTNSCPQTIGFWTQLAKPEYIVNLGRVVPSCKLERQPLSNNDQIESLVKYLSVSLTYPMVVYYYNLLLYLQSEENYRQFLEKLERQYKFDLSEYVVPHRAHSTGRSLKFALLMSQRILIYLGDIARYRTQNEQTADYGRARK